MALVAAFFVPSEPVLVPEVGRGRERAASKTIAALRRAARRLAASPAETILFIRAEPGRATPAIGPSAPSIRRDFSRFDAPELERTDPVDGALVETLAPILIPSPSASPVSPDLDAVSLPDDLLVAAYFLDAAARLPKAVLTLPMDDVDRAATVGRAVSDLLSSDTRAAAIVAVGNLSARIFPGAPDGYHPQAAAWDQRLVQALTDGDRDATSALVPLAASVGETCLVQLVALGTALGPSLGTLEATYEHPFGTGYVVAGWELDHGNLRSPANSA